MLLLGSNYKLLAKVLVNRLSPIMDSLISSNQSSFIKGALLQDGVLVVNEELDLIKCSKKDCLIFKVDFKKV